MTDNQFWRLLLTLVFVYIMGMFVNIMDIDAAQYASMSREMLESGSFLEVYEQGRDYLDKPPLIFWLSSVSMSFFGATNFGYKFPSLIFAILALYSTYRFALLFYGKTIAQVATLILASSQALFMITNDCRTDTVLMGCVMFAIWQLATAFTYNSEQKTNENTSQRDKEGEYIQNKHPLFLHFLLGFIGIGLGMLAKGPVAIVIPVLAFSAHFIYKKEYKNFLRIEYLWGLVVIGVILLPMCIGLYQQFDMHPEKEVNGKTGVSGLRFYFWVQSFGRITGENHWRNAVHFGYLLQTMFYTFAPWILLFIAAYIAGIWNLIKKNILFEQKELISLGGFTLGYISLGLSKYQLPHYIFIVFPLASVMTAQFIVQVLYEKKDWMSLKILRGVQWFVTTALWALPFLIMFYVFPTTRFSLIIMAIFVVVHLIFSFQNKNLFVSTISTVIGINLFLSLSFYPQLLSYQVGSEVGQWVRANEISYNRFYTYRYPATASLHFYAQRIVNMKQTPEEVKVGDWLLTDEKGLNELQDAGLNLHYEETGNSFPVTNMTPEFVNNETRPNTVGQYFLVRVKEAEPIPEIEEAIEPESE